MYFPPEAVEAALRVSWCESNWRDVVSADGQNWGRFQINSVHAGKVNGPVSRLLEPEENVRVAAIIYRDSGWGPWACRP